MSRHDGRRGFIHHTAVMTEYRGKGMGKKFVDSALAVLEAEGIHKVALVVFEKLYRAIFSGKMLDLL